MHAILKYPRTRHLAGSALQKGDEDDRLSMASLKGRDLLFVWEEKADGANAGLSFDPAGGDMVLQSRGHSLDGGSRERQFNMYKAWAQTFESDFREALGKRYVLYGEWMAAKHSSAYDNLPHLLLTYDLYDRERSVFLSTKARAGVLDGLPIVPVHVVHEGWVADRDVPKLVRHSVYKTPNWRESLKNAAIAAGVDPARALAETDDTDLAEGVYLKVENERGETLERGKFVRAAFIQHILDSGSHWASRPIIENRLAPGVDLFAHPGATAKGRAMSIDWKTFGVDGAIDWRAIEAEFPYVNDMAACIQDKIYHAEGDVLTHTRMVMDHLLADPEFRALPPDRRNVMALAVLWHDVSKPETRTEIFDEELGRLRVSHPHHAAKGAYRAWRDLWRAGVPVHIRFDVFAHVLGHQQIFRVLKTDGDHRPALAKLSTLGSLYELTMLAKADNRGRICADPLIAEDEMELVRLAAAECGCLDRPWPFASSQARLRFARRVADSLFFEPRPPQGSRVIVLSGLPGSGKDTYVRTVLGDYGHVSLDVTREAMDVAPTDNQGRVAQATLEACRVHLRAKAPFVFNATNLTRLQRAKIITLAIAYDAHVTVHALDVSEARIRQQNREREASVPEKVLDAMIEKWEPPTLLEAHDVVWIGSDFRTVPKPATVAAEAAPTC